MSKVFEFRILITPRWDVLAPILKEGAAVQGLTWPSGIKPLQFAKRYALSLAGEQDLGSGLPTRFKVVAREPPKEPVVAENIRDFADLQISFGVQRRKLWESSNDGRDIDFEALAPKLTGEGIELRSARASQTLVPVPYAAMLRVMSAVADKKTRLHVVQSDHIVEHLKVPTELSGFKLSHWRGDASYRLSHSGADLEIWVKPRV